MIAIKKIAFIGVVLLSAVSTAFASDFFDTLAKKPRRLRDFKCDDTFYMSSHPYSQGVTELSTLDPYTATAKAIATAEGHGYDAIGFNHRDGYLYGIDNYPPTGGQPLLIRIDPVTGDITPKGALEQLGGKEWIVGTIIEDGTYVVGDFATNTYLQIDVENSRVIDHGHIPTSLVTAWAANPIDNVIYGYQSYTMQLMAFDPTTKLFRSFDKPLTNVGVVPCSTAFHQDGQMFLYCKTGDPDHDKMFTIDLVDEKATEIATGNALGAGDLASCAFAAPTPTPTPTPVPTPTPEPTPTPTPGPSPTPSPTPTPTPPPTPTPIPTPTPMPPPKDIPGSWQHGKECIEISDDGRIAENYRKCLPLVKCGKQTGFVTYNEDGKGIAHYRQDRSVQELNLLTPRRMEVTEHAKLRLTRRIYEKVRKCHWRAPKPPPGPEPTPTPTPKPTPPPRPR